MAEEHGVAYIREPRAGLDWARNRALLEATTPVVAFTDDDVLVHPGWIAGIARAFREEPDAVAVTVVIVKGINPLEEIVIDQGGMVRL